MYRAFDLFIWCQWLMNICIQGINHLWIIDEFSDGRGAPRYGSKRVLSSYRQKGDGWMYGGFDDDFVEILLSNIAVKIAPTLHYWWVYACTNAWHRRFFSWVPTHQVWIIDAFAETKQQTIILVMYKIVPIELQTGSCQTCFSSHSFSNVCIPRH